MLLVLQCVAPAHAKGKGPVGMWLASERYALVADSSLPGLVLVDLDTGVAVERMTLDGVRPAGIASCPDCDFAIIIGGSSDVGIKASFWRLHFTGTVSRLLEAKGELGLANARLESLDISPDGQTLKDGRRCLVSDDGKAAYVTSSHDKAVVRVDLTQTPSSTFLLRHRNAKPHGINWDGDGNLLVTMHKNQIWRMTIDGKVLATYDTERAGCPGESELKPNLRAAVDDPVNANSLLILASNPRSYDAVVWRLTVEANGEQSCSAVAGKIGVAPGWIDASGEAVTFSRPHFFALRPDRMPPQLVITDIDNRALRLLDLTTYATSSVMYDRDRLVRTLPPEERLSTASCAELNWPARVSATGETTCVRQAPADAADMSLAQAAAYCRAAGARLCEPAELLSPEPARDTKAWTAAECASCWQRSEREACDIKEEDHKTPGIVHSHADFSQSWRSGQALVVGAAGGAQTLCRPFDDNLKAAAPCCADTVQRGAL
jgi:hypothetical protein